MSDNHTLMQQRPTDDGWNDAAQEASERTIRGTLLKFADWRWTAGKEATPVEDGTKLVALATTAMWVRWDGGKPVEYRVREPGRRMPERDELGHDDESLWELSPSGEPKDPWQNTRFVYLVDPHTAEAFTFSTATYGGREAVSDLGDKIARMRTVHPDAVPVVELRAVENPTKYGRKSKPVFKVVAWKTADATAPAPAEKQITAQAAERKMIDDEFLFDRTLGGATMSNSETLLRLQLRAAGFSPLPLNGKAPSSVKGWQTKLNAGDDEIELWEKLYPYDCNTGILTRFAPAIDIDILNPEAAEAVEMLARERFEEHGDILVRVGKAPKRAILFRTDEPFDKITANVVSCHGGEEKIELLANGQQLAAFGTHPETKRAYVWHGGEPGKTTRESLPYIREADARQFMTDAVQLLVNEYSYSAKAEMKTADDAGAHDEGPDWEELVDNIRTGSKLHDSICRLSAKLITGGLNERAASNLLHGMMDASTAPHDARWRTRYRRIAHDVATAAKKFNQEQQPESLTLHWQSEESSNVARDWLIADLLPLTGTGLLAGQWGVYKTFVALDLASAIMAGLAFIDYPVARRGGVLFIAAEGAAELPIRLKAVLTTKYPENKRVPFAWLATCPRLLDARAVDVLAAVAAQAAEHMRKHFDLPLALIVIDTVVDAAGYTRSGDENDAAINQIMMTRCAELARRTGAFVVGVDHFGKAVETGTRGSSAKEGRADVVLALLGDKAVSGEVANTRLAVRKNRAGPSGRELSFAPRVIELGTDESGRQITSLVVDWQADGTSSATTRPDTRWAKSLRLLRQVLMNTLVEHGKDIRPFTDGPTVRAVNVEIARAEFYRCYLAEGDAAAKRTARQKAFRRAVNDAQARGLIGLCDVGSETVMWLAHVMDEPSQKTHD